MYKVFGYDAFCVDIELYFDSFVECVKWIKIHEGMNVLFVTCEGRAIKI